MSALSGFLLLIFGLILLHGHALPYGDLFSKYEHRDDYYEDYYLRKIPKLKTTPKKVKEFLLNHLSWFPADELREEEREDKHKSQRRSYYFHLQVEGTTTTVATTTADATVSTSQNPCNNKICDLTVKVREKYRRVKNYTHSHRVTANWTKIKFKSRKSFQQAKVYIKTKKLKNVWKNVTQPFKKSANNSGPECSNDDYKYLGPSVRIHPKNFRLQAIKSQTTESPMYFPDTHFSIPRKIKVIIDLQGSDRAGKSGRNVDEKYLPRMDGDEVNSTNVLGTAGEVASDLAGRMTSLWHCVVGSHRVPDTRDVKFYLYTRRNVILPELLKVDYNLISRKVRANPEHKDVECVDLPPENIPEFERVSDENRKIIKSNFLNIKAPTKILIHGYTGSYKDSRMSKIKDAYLTNGRYNVIQVDWEMLAAPPCYIRVTHHSKFVGETIAKFLDGLHLVGLNMSLVHLVGFSLGAQVAGFAGNNNTLIPVCRITGLDPALPLFLHTQPSGHLDRLDAKFVDVIHTCGGILAMLDPLGHVDFYPNGGTKQPGCEFSNLKCSHSRAPQYFAESVVSQKKFTGQLCLTWEEYVAGDCNNTTDVSFMGEPCSRKSVYGKYYLLTKSKEPFVL